MIVDQDIKQMKMVMDANYASPERIPQDLELVPLVLSELSQVKEHLYVIHARVVMNPT